MNTTSFPAPCPFVTPADQLARAQNIAGAVRFSELAPQKVRWLWPDRIPLGRITLLVSDPGLGKSLLALDIAARVSRGAPWPDECSRHTPCAVTELANDRDHGDDLSGNNSKHMSHSPAPSVADGTRSVPATIAPASVLLLTAEDDFADTVRPRLEALGADCDRILGIATVPGNDAENRPRAFALTRDIARLRDLLNAMPDCRLIVIDPISAYLGRTNEHSNADIQSLLLGLTTIARERDIAILAVGHLRKKDGAAIYRPMGSLAFVAASRAAWAICKDPHDPTKRLFLPVKNNLAPHITGLAYTIETSPDGRGPTIRWSPEPVAQSLDFAIAAARAAGRPDEERQHAIKWLKERLEKSACKASDIREEAEVLGISYGTIRRAFRDIEGTAFRKGMFPIFDWYWSLPGRAAQNPGGEFCAIRDLADIIPNLAELAAPFTPVPTTSTLPG
jgi:putative DNA primase/helicase